MGSFVFRIYKALMADKFIGHLNSVLHGGGRRRRRRSLCSSSMYNVHTIWPLCTAINAAWLHSIKSPGFSGR